MFANITTVRPNFQLQINAVKSRIEMLQQLLLVLLVAVSYAQATDMCKMCKHIIYFFTCCVQYLMCCCSSGNISELMIAPAHNITIESGTTVSLTCSAQHTSGQNCSMCLVWKHGDVLLSDGKFTLLNNTASSLIINANDQENYSCQTIKMPVKTKSVYITTASENKYTSCTALLSLFSSCLNHGEIYRNSCWQYNYYHLHDNTGSNKYHLQMAVQE